MVLPSLPDADHAHDAARRLIFALASALKIEGRTIHAAVSVGVAVAVTLGSGSTADQMLRDADMAINYAKKNGRNRYEIFENSM